jgi:hypothetical protein
MQSLGCIISPVEYCGLRWFIFFAANVRAQGQAGLAALSFD